MRNRTVKLLALSLLCASSLTMAGCNKPEEVPNEETPMMDKPPVICDTLVSKEPEVPVIEPAPAPKPIIYYTQEDAVMLARLTYGEARGIKSVTEQACVMWTVLNRADVDYNGNGGIAGQITAPSQFCYIKGNPTVDDHGRDLVELANDVLSRWNREKNGETDVGRVLPADYMWFRGDGKHNHFRNEYKGGSTWDYSLDSPYEN